MNWPISHFAKTILDRRAEGFSASEIAQEISKLRPGTTRNSVLGYLFRLDNKANGIKPFRPKPVRSAIALRQNPRKKKTSAPPGIASIEEMVKPAPRHFVPGRGRTILELRHNDCRYIIHERQTRYCGEPIADRSFCEHHFALCYLPPEKKRKRMANYGLG